MTGVILAIAGSDPSGGAGIQADLKTMATIGVYGCAAITCLTVQNTRGVFSCKAVAANLVREQIVKVLEDLPVTHIKTGMIGTARVAEAVGTAIRDFTGELICDPVIRASDGTGLLTPNGLLELREQIIHRATVLTPNLEELSILTDSHPKGTREILTAGQELLKRFPRLAAVILKGGHIEPQHDQVTDHLLIRNRQEAAPTIIPSTRPRIQRSGTHGTGCTFASAFTAFHLLSGSHQEAFVRAGDYINNLLLKGIGEEIGQGEGPLHHHLAR